MCVCVCVCVFTCIYVVSVYNRSFFVLMSSDKYEVMQYLYEVNFISSKRFTFPSFSVNLAFSYNLFENGIIFWAWKWHRKKNFAITSGERKKKPKNCSCSRHNLIFDISIELCEAKILHSEKVGKFVGVFWLLMLIPETKAFVHRWPEKFHKFTE